MKQILLTLLFTGFSLATFECSNAQGPDQRRMDRRRQMRREMDRRGRNSDRFDRSSDTQALKVGDVAPEFKLKSIDGKSTTELAAFKDKKPVVLLFGSYT